jgi:hypothetical protein
MYLRKYLEFKNNLQGGVSDEDKNKPLFIYLLGQNKTSDICTLLDQINTIIRYSNISKNRINLIYGDNVTEKHICDRNHEKIPLPYGVDVNYIDKYDENDFTELIKTILENKTNNQTPIIFMFDGNYINGKMIMHDSLTINSKILEDSTNKNKKKLFMNLNDFSRIFKFITFNDIINKIKDKDNYDIQNINELYPQQNLHGGVSDEDKNKPLFIYLLGQEKNIDMRGYICTSLIQIDNIIQYTGISKNRINVIYGDNETDEHTCYIDREYAVPYHNKPLPHGVDVNYLWKNNYDMYDFKKLITNILKNKTNDKTPIILMFDGHGCTNTGTMVMNDLIKIDYKTLIDLFSTKQDNKKLFIFNQCFSKNYHELLTSDKENLLMNSIYICSKNCLNKTSVGTGLFRRLKQFLDTNEYETFNDMEEKFKMDQNYFIEDKQRIRIQDIFKSYRLNKPVISVDYKPIISVDMFKKDEQIYLIAEDDAKKEFYFGYEISINGGIKEAKSKWIINNISRTDSNYYFTFATVPDHSYSEKTYLDNNEFYQNKPVLSFTNTDSLVRHTLVRQYFKINSDFSLQSLNDNYYLLYDSSNKTFIRGQKIPTGKLHLVKLKKID